MLSAAKLGLTFAPEHRSAWEKIRESLAEAVKLSHPDPSKVVCVFSDASDRFWGSMVTQVSKEDLRDIERYEDMRHEPLAFLSGVFKGAQLAWSVTDKEAFAIVMTYVRLDYLFYGHSVIFTDHRNLAYIFNASRDLEEVSKATSQRLRRWSVILGKFTYAIWHIAGEDNVFGDMLSRMREEQVIYKRTDPGKPRNKLHENLQLMEYELGYSSLSLDSPSQYKDNEVFHTSQLLLDREISLGEDPRKSAQPTRIILFSEVLPSSEVFPGTCAFYRFFRKNILKDIFLWL